MRLSEDQVEHLVSRFLGWRLPEDFRPDNGISYQRPSYHPSVDATPNGTNLFDATQARAMVRYMLEGLPPGVDAEVSLDMVIAHKIEAAHQAMMAKLPALVRQAVNDGVARRQIRT